MRRRFQGRASGDDVRAPLPPPTRLPRVFRHPPNNARLRPVYRVRTRCNLECSRGHPCSHLRVRPLKNPTTATQMDRPNKTPHKTSAPQKSVRSKDYLILFHKLQLIDFEIG